MVKKNKSQIIRNFVLMFLMVSIMFIYPVELSYANDGGASGSSYNANQFCQALVGGLDIKDSLVLSALSGCLPGILENLMEARAINCEYIHCYYDSAIHGMSTEMCEDQRDFRKCSQVMGEVTAIPPLAMLENIREVIAQILADPYGLAWSALVMGARSYLSNKDQYNSVVDGLMATTLAVHDLTSLYKQLERILEFEFRNEEWWVDACDGVDDIVEEAEEVKEAYS